MDQYRQDWDLSAAYREDSSLTYQEIAEELGPRWDNDCTYSETDFIKAAQEFFHLPIEEALQSENGIIKILAILDKRTGKRTLRRILEQGEYLRYPAWVRFFYTLRFDVEDIENTGKNTAPNKEIAMEFDTLQQRMMEQLHTHEPFERAKESAYRYLDGLKSKRVFPSDEAIAGLAAFDEALPDAPGDPNEILGLLDQSGSPAAVAQCGGKYFGFVTGSYYPVAAAARWIADVWDQNSGLYVMSPISSRLEEICENWIADLLGLPEGTAAGIVSGSSVAILCALAAARNELLRRQGWDAGRDGLFGAPPLRVVLGEQAHSSVFKALSLLGLGQNRVELAPADDEGRIIPEKLPKLDANTLLILQAGHVNSGAFDPMDELCKIGRAAGAWIHIDGAFGLWAAASKEKYPLIKGFDKADSWSGDAHKTLNAPYDCGVVLCRDRAALQSALQASGSYLQYSEHRDGMLYTPEMSRRARSMELWATLKCLGRSGVAALVDGLCANAKYFSEKLSEQGFEVLNDVVYNQALVRCETTAITAQTLKNIQLSGDCWCGGAQWKGEPVIRLSVCSWQTTRKDIDDCVGVFIQAREKARGASDR